MFLSPDTIVCVPDENKEQKAGKYRADQSKADYMNGRPGVKEIKGAQAEGLSISPRWEAIFP
jgi:hypothetical protein